MSLPSFASMLSFITYSLSKHVLDPAPIFSSLALFNSLRFPLSLLPLVITQVTDAWVSMGRIQEFLTAEEQNEDFDWDMDAKDAVSLRHADFTWERTVTRDESESSTKQLKKSKNTQKIRQHEKESETTLQTESDASEIAKLEPFKLSDIDLSIASSELVAIIGGVGSGKSSLLAALAGDMRRIRGTVTMGATRSFCPQYAWIQNASVKENILFGKDYDRTWYDKVVDACALRPDLEMLPHGDLTEIGERGT